ncbi:hypothetical protein F4778DRAFT_36299 [Xylariomycetidae sp. FL2044]|nr:hypothetical protein F4778DRAFT_36299 [Xylariomycetidae sp. FL2044]
MTPSRWMFLACCVLEMLDVGHMHLQTAVRVGELGRVLNEQVDRYVGRMLQKLETQTEQGLIPATVMFVLGSCRYKQNRQQQAQE